MKKIAVVVSAVVAMALLVTAGVAYGHSGRTAAPASCSNTVWNVGLGSGTEAPYVMDPLTECGKKLSGTAGKAGGCKEPISGTMKRHGKVRMSWDGSLCGVVTHFTGVLHVKSGSGSGTWSDSGGGSGTWTAAKTS